MSNFDDARKLKNGDVLKADYIIIGSGAGGSVLAARLAQAKKDVLVVEEGGHHTSAEFNMREDEAFPMLYQEAGGRMTKDLSMTVLQGRAVGGSTVVNWTTSFRTPEKVVAHWQKHHAVGGFDSAALAPHFAAVEERLSVKQISIEESNANNKLLYLGCKELGLSVETTFRNTKNCAKTGYCGMGCPIDAKQSMLVTYLPDAVAAGARVMSRLRVDKLESAANEIRRAHCTVLGDDGYTPTDRKVTLEGKRFILAAGAIGSPSILIRSGLGDERTGRRTFLHPVIATLARHKDAVNGFYGAPQSVASHAFADRGADPGFFLEAAPVHPMLGAMSMSGFGPDHRARMAVMPFMTAHVALVIDGFHPSEIGGTVEVRPKGSPVLDYIIPPRIWAALREGLKQLARIDFASGAVEVYTGHDPALVMRKPADLEMIDRAPFEPGKVAVFSAHVMGGCTMGDDPARAVVRSSDLRHHRFTNLHVVDGSVLPTSLGVNPQETIYGIAHLMSERIAAL